MKKFIGVLFATALIGFAVIAIIDLKMAEVARTVSTSAVLGSTEQVRFNSANTQTGILVGTGSTLILATSSARQYAILVNDSPIYTIYLSMNKGAPAALYSGIALKPGTSFTINANNGYIGAIYGIATTSATTTVYER